MSKCNTCDKELSNNAQYCKACGSDQTRPDTLLDKKKTRVTGQKRSWAKPAIIAGAVVIIAAVAWAVMSHNRMGSLMSNQGSLGVRTDSSALQTKYTAVKAESGFVRVPLPALDDRKAHFYLYSTAGQAIKFFVLRASDGTVRAAFDACTACYHAKQGYRQDGNDMVCNNCGQRFQSINIGTVKGGCNPIPLDNALEKQTLVLKVKDLEAAAKYF